MYDIAIIGGGPAGIAAAIYSLRAGKKTVIFEGNLLGGILNQIKKIDNYPGFKSISGKALAKKMSDQLYALNPDVIKSFVVKVLKDDNNFEIVTNTDVFSAKKVIFCGGERRNSIKAAENFKGNGISYCATCDGYFYRGKTVAVAGSGYTAKEDVEYLLPLCSKLYLIGKKIPDLDVETINSDIASIEGKEKIESIILKNGRKLVVDGLFIALGEAGADDILEDAGETGIFRAGDITKNFRQIVWACAEGARAATFAIGELNREARKK